MKSGLVTVTLSVYNLENLVSKAIESVIEQTYTEWELIAIDDASTDRTYEVMKAYECPKIKVFKNKINRGTYWNRNRAILFGEGEFITNIDGDDQFHPDKLRKQVQALQGYVACYGLYKRTGISTLNHSITSKDYSSNTMMFRTSLIDEIGYFDSVRYGADYEYMSRIERKHALVEINETLLYYRYRVGSLTKTEETGTNDCYIGKQYRLQYEKNWRKWHDSNSSLYLNFPQLKRSFPVGNVNQEVPAETFTVSMATFPERQESLKKVLESIYPWIDKINIFLNEYNEIPAFLEDSKITIHRSREDLGDRGKFYWVEKTQGYHFFCDDDIEYSRNYFGHLANSIEKYDRQAIVGLHGSNLISPNQSYYSKEGRKKYTFRQQRDSDIRVEFLGTGVMAYHTENIAIPFSIFEQNNMADVFLGLYAKQFGISLICCANPTNLVRDINELSEYENSIFFDSCNNRATKFNKRDAVDRLLKQRW